LSPPLIIANVLIVKTRALQFFSAAAGVLVTAAAFAALSRGQIYSLKLVDVDGNVLRTDDGHITTVVLTTDSDIDRVRSVGDRIPNHCLGNPTFRMITVVRFKRKHSRPVRAILAALIRRRLQSEGQRLQQRYDQLKIARAARADVHAVADFDGAIATQLGSAGGDAVFRVFVFGRNGPLLEEWNHVPNADELAKALK
jgi:hypothetical protein